MIRFITLSVLIIVEVQGYGYDAFCSCSACLQFTNPRCSIAEAECERIVPDTAIITDYACSSGDTSYDCVWSDSTSYIGHCPAALPTYEEECEIFCQRMNCSSTYSCDVWPDDDDDKEWCFHIDSLINYKGNIYSFADLMSGAEEECTVPHVATARGVVIDTSCHSTLRLTSTHLVLTPNGLKSAGSLIVGTDSILLHGGDGACAVTAVSREMLESQYFGLNCIHSYVTVDGLYVSTFGDLHYIPAVYMYVFGNVLGVKFASSVGKYFSGMYHYFSWPKNLINFYFL